jgi:hypothetical protein
MWQQLHQNNLKSEAKHALLFWGLLAGATALNLGVILGTEYLPHTRTNEVNKVTTRAAVGVISLGLLGFAAATLKDYEQAETTNELGRAVIARNNASWINKLTQPTHTAMSAIESASNIGAASLLPLFDWGELADPDEHPTLAIISPMGGGKSRLAKFLAKHVLFPGQNPDLVAMDIYGRPADWQDATLLTDHGAMLEQMSADLGFISDRAAEYRKGVDNFTPRFWILEEAPDTIGTLRKSGKDADELVTAWVTKASTVARKVKARLCLVSVRLSGAEIGVSAEARNDATVIFPGKKGIAKAMADDRIFKLGAKQNKELRETLAATLATIARPALVYAGGHWHPASIPECDAFGNPTGYQAIAQVQQQQLPQVTPEPMDDRDRLEAMYRIEPDEHCHPSELESEPEWKAIVRDAHQQNSELWAALLAAIPRLSISKKQAVGVGAVRKFHRHLQDLEDGIILAAFCFLESEGEGVCRASRGAIVFLANGAE